MRVSRVTHTILLIVNTKENQGETINMNHKVSQKDGIIMIVRKLQYNIMNTFRQQHEERIPKQ